jgi:hypothetical protein
VLGEDVEMVAVRVKRRDSELGPSLAVVAVVVVGADVSDMILAESSYQPAGDRRLAGSGVADDAENDRARTNQSPSARTDRSAGGHESTPAVSFSAASSASARGPTPPNAIAALAVTRW